MNIFSIKLGPRGGQGSLLSLLFNSALNVLASAVRLEEEREKHMDGKVQSVIGTAHKSLHNHDCVISN